MTATFRGPEKKAFGFRSLAEVIQTATMVFPVFQAQIQFLRDLISDRTGGRPSKLKPQLCRQAEATLRDSKCYPFISEVIRSDSIGSTAFYRHFPNESTRAVSRQWQGRGDLPRLFPVKSSGFALLARQIDRYCCSNSLHRFSLLTPCQLCSMPCFFGGLFKFAFQSMA